MLDQLLDLMRRLPPQRTEENLASLVDICPDQADDLLSHVDQPLRVQTDSSGRQYLICDYNRDGDSYRSPWTNEYDPPIEDGTKPSPQLRELEVAARDAFDVYRELYFDGGVHSVYLWDLDSGFAGVVLIKKTVPISNTQTGTWDSIHVFETGSDIASSRGNAAHYKLTSTVMLHMTRTSDKAGEVALAGSMTRQQDNDFPIQPVSSSSSDFSPSHIANIGRMIEDMEIKMRNLLHEVYFAKTKDVVDELRSLAGEGERNKLRGVQRELVGLLKKQASAGNGGAS